MFDRDTLAELFRHMEWADATVWRAVLGHQPAHGDERLRSLLLHLHTVQRAFLLVWTQQPVTFPERDDVADLSSVYRWNRPTYADAHRFLASLDEADFTRSVVMPWASQLAAQLGREPAAPSLAETMFQIVSHSTYHRGQVNARLREIGGEPPLVDYIAWIWFGRPEPEWQEVA